MKPIYKPKGKAKEYGDYAINIYTGCPHRCYYCFAPSVLRRDREQFHANVMPRDGIVEAVKKQLETDNITDKIIHLCFTCDPYPMGYDTTPTREIIKLIKESGNHVQVLTKGDGSRDFDLLDKDDWYGATYTGEKPGTLFMAQEAEPNAAAVAIRLAALARAHEEGISTWVSMEPVLDAVSVLNFLELNVGYVDKYKIGKLNYHPSDIQWSEFGKRVERICCSFHMDYYIKDNLRAMM
jgi:DNA repair photolyase